jgi:hypothetical protein
LEEFAREGVEFVIVGGYAFAFHARPRATKDLDLLLRGDAANLERAATALARFGAPGNVVAPIRARGTTTTATDTRCGTRRRWPTDAMCCSCASTRGRPAACTAFPCAFRTEMPGEPHLVS